MNLNSLILDNYDKLNEIDRHIGSFILNNKVQCKDMSIEDLSKETKVSYGSIMQFTKKIGLEGYAELRFLIKWEEKEREKPKRVDIERTKKEFAYNMEYMDKGNFDEVFKKIDSAKHIYAYGSGTVQKHCVKELKRNFIYINKFLHTIEGKNEFKFVSNLIDSRDIIFLVSYSGENKFLNEVAYDLSLKNIYIVSITRDTDNTLRKISNFNFPFQTSEVYCLDENISISPMSHYFLIVDFLILRYYEYYEKKRPIRQ